MEVFENQQECARCKNVVASDDQFCTHCGNLLIDFVFCNNHIEREAEGVCLICSVPFCKTCGAFLNGIFLCDEHTSYEVIDGMVRIFGVIDTTSAEYAKTCLEQAGYHPIVFSRSSKERGGSPIGYTFDTPEGDNGRYFTNEVKVMVPMGEVMDAENVLRELKILQ
jgi:hypothetical protein